MKLIKLFILLAGLIFTNSIYSQEKAVADTTDKSSVTVEIISLEELMKIGIISSTKFEQKIIETPNVISLFTNKQIAQNGWRSLNDVMAKLPSYSISQDYERPTLSSRGLYEGWNNNHILFLVDGIPMNDNLYGTFYSWDVTPLSMVKTIEVIRGPGSALYGSNAMNGVVQINTLSIVDFDKTHKFSLKYGNYGQRQYSFLSTFSTPLLSSVFAFNHSQTDGYSYTSYDGSGELDNTGKPVSHTTMDARESNYFWVKLEGRESLSDLSFQYHYQNWKFQTGHGWLWSIPDFNESMIENRHIFAIKYKPFISLSVFPEILIRYQVHEVNWNIRFYRNNAFDGFYQAGMWEYLNTSANDLFVRTQFTYLYTEEISLLGGIEADMFFYDGDKAHYSNIDVDNTFAPFDAGNSYRDLGPALDYIKGKPVTNIGFYAQMAVKNFLISKLNLTLGLRYDTEFFKYSDVIAAGKPEKSKDFSQLNLRLAFVYQIADNLALKALWGKAFRAPSPTEMFGAHTFTLASNISQLKPEILNTFEFAIDWVANSNLNWRANFFYTKNENQIAYSAQNNNLSTNIFSSTNWGIETELIYGFKNITGFLNASVVSRVSEEIQDNTIMQNSDLTWVPPFVANCGFTYSMDNFLVSLNAHYQAAAKRRGNEIGTQIIPLSGGVSLNLDKYRTNELSGWISFDANASYKLNNNLKLGVSIYNIFDSDNLLLKNGSFPFDYRQIGRNFQLSLNLEI